MKLYKPIENLTAREWTRYLYERVEELTGDTVQHRDYGAMASRFTRLLNDYHYSPYLLGVVLDDMISGTDAWYRRVGATVSLLTNGTVEYAVTQRGGWDQPWDALFYSQFCQTVPELLYFKHYLAQLEDARVAPEGVAVWVDGKRLSAEEYGRRADRKLDRAVRAIRKRAREEPPVETVRLEVPRLEPVQSSALRDQVLVSLRGER